MKKRIWILNHYATNQYYNEGGRHYWFAENLKNEGYIPTVFCANTRHNSNEAIDTNGEKFKVKKDSHSIPYVIVNTIPYAGKRLDRLKNMLMFAKNLLSVSESYAIKEGKPDIILASSVHPFTLVAGIKIAKKFGIPCICEVRDLWPESIVAYGLLKRNSIIAKTLYKGEKWIYKKADSIIMTWEGGKDYIREQGWQGEIDIGKVHHINNGVDMELFDRNSVKCIVKDDDLMNPKFKKIVYTGSIRKVNNLSLLIDVAQEIKKKNRNDIRFLIYGSGNELDELKKRIIEENVDNIVFKGKVEKKFVPYILKNADINILHNTSTDLDKFGQSQNKLFEYLAAGKGIIQTYKTGYSILEKNRCGINTADQNPLKIAEEIISLLDNPSLLTEFGNNARITASYYDFKYLTKKLINIIENSKTGSVN